jgi:hypothetical protein
MKNKELQEIIEKKYNKYNELIWYARIRPEYMHLEGIIEHKKRIEEEFAEEITELHGEYGEWQHGFNSGCCAAFYYVLSCLDKKMGLEQAEEEFPMLDT